METSSWRPSRAAELCEDKRVLVVPTKNVAMGIAAAVAFQPEQTPEENAAHMNEGRSACTDRLRDLRRARQRAG